MSDKYESLLEKGIFLIRRGLSLTKCGTLLCRINYRKDLNSVATTSFFPFSFGFGKRLPWAVPCSLNFVVNIRQNKSI
jgi:hypothetical protein